ncbi:phosphoglycerate mutase-like protein [Rickenella mellea]|uniref:Phosphoglycerate mutase-like protein n=1 Tax=Rickenella mellea TaxID=50990 RepID=A0A4Y7QMX5_9AGAM|nr:phosphoglycerate mutase-like protein [Rickenella mellea]
MSSKPMPRLFLIRHGETEWSINGRHTGRTDLPLTPNGEQIIKTRSPLLVGQGKLINPDTLCHVFVSPRQRAQKTFELLFSDLPKLPPHETCDAVREWDYGDYEGLTREQIRSKDKYWSIWRTGCPGGESADDMTRRVDGVIEEVQEIHRKYYEDGIGRRDVMIVAHGHFSRVLISRWVQFPVSLGTHFNVEPAGVALLSYNHHSLKEPALNGLNLYADHK